MKTKKSGESNHRKGALPLGWLRGMTVLLAALAVAAFLPGCLKDPKDDSGPMWGVTMEGREAEAAVFVGMTEAEMKDGFGEALRMEQSESCAAQGWDRIYRYSAVRVYVFVPAESTEGRVVSFSFLTDGVWLSDANHITIGTDRARVRESLGTPDEEAEERWVYRSGGGILTLVFREDRITALSLE